MPKPLKILPSPLSTTPRFYAFRDYQEVKLGAIKVTGTKEDVTPSVMQCADWLIAILIEQGHLEVTSDASAKHLNTLFAASR